MSRSNELPLSFAVMQNRLLVAGDLVALTALRIGAGRSTAITGSDLPVLRDSTDRPFIPGASLKGTLRAQTEALVRTVAPDQVLDARELEKHLEDVIRPKLNDPVNRNNDYALSKDIWQDSKLIDLTFGSLWNASRVFVKDALIHDELWFEQHETRNGVAINRDTETAEDQRLYDYEVTPAGTRFGFELVMENAEEWQLGMLLLMLKPWARGDVSIGGFRSRGLGRVKLEANYTYVRIDDDIDTLFNLVQHGLARTGTPVTADDEIRWVKAFKERLQKLIL